MRIDVIETAAGFDAIRENWNAVYMADPHAQHFLSWVWLKAYLARRGRWFILALKEKEEGLPYVAFFPLRVVTQLDKKTGRFFDDIVMAGNSAADYTGFITRPEYEHNAVAGFCAFIKEQRWTHVKLDNFSGPPSRRDAMIRALQGPLVMFRDNPPANPDNIDNTVCPVVTLPASFETYLETGMTSQSGQLRQGMRRVENGDKYRITVATPETIERDMDALFDLWRIRWAPSKGKERTERIIVTTRQMFMDCFEDGNLDVPVLWHGDQPLAALANIIDREKGAVLVYMTGRDQTWKKPSPAFVLHGYCIRRAIDMGFKHYDFMRGNEPYKYLFGPEERRISCTLFRTRSGENLQGKLHHFSTGFVYEQALNMYKKGMKSQAETAFRQVLETVPDHRDAEFGLANLLFEKGDFQAAELSYLSISRSVADPIPALLRLGETRLAQRDYSGAVTAFQDVTTRAPFHREALYKCGIALVAAGRRNEAAAIFEKLQSYHSDDTANMEYAEKAKAALARLKMSVSSAQTTTDTVVIAGQESQLNRLWTPPKVLH